MAEVGTKGEIPDPFNPAQPLPLKDIIVDDKYREMFSSLTDEELRKCIALSDSEDAFTFTARYKHRDKETRIRLGERAIQAQPLVFMLSLTVKSQEESVAIYGTINVSYTRLSIYYTKHKLYECKEDDPQFVGTDGVLAFNNDPYVSSARDHACLPLLPVRDSIYVNLELSHGSSKQCFPRNFYLNVEFEDGSYGGVKSEFIPHEESVKSDDEGVKSDKSIAGATLRYLVIPFGVSCCIGISIFCRHSSREDYSLSVSGKIVAKYGNRHDEYKEIEFILFDKQGSKHETVDEGGSLQLSRCWVAVPAYSSLVFDIILSISGTDVKDATVNDSVELLPQQGGASDDSIVLDDYIVTANVGWFSPDYHWPPYPEEHEDTEQEEYVPDDGWIVFRESDAWWHPRPPPMHFLEVFSVYIGLVNPPTEKLEGSIKVSSKDEMICSIFNGDNKNNPWMLSKHSQVIHVLDGSHDLKEYVPLELEVDIRDAKSLTVKGYENWEAHFLDTDLWFDKMLCAVIRGQNGFAAVHYSIFSTGAVAQDIKIIIKSDDLTDVDDNSKVYGSIKARYSCFDHPSKYEEDCYSSVLFERRTAADAVCFKTDEGNRTIPLSRTKTHVPSGSSIILTFDLSFGKDFAKKLSLFEYIHMLRKVTPVRNNEDSEFSFTVEVDWQLMKRE